MRKNITELIKKEVVLGDGAHLREDLTSFMVKNVCPALNLQTS